MTWHLADTARPRRLLRRALFVSMLAALSSGFCADRVVQEFDYAKALGEQGFFDLAESVYSSAIAAHPDHEKVEEAVLAVAALKAQMKRMDEALADYEAFLKKYGYSKLKGDAQVGIAEIHFEQKDFDKARQEFKSILDASKDGASEAYVRAQFGYAWCLIEGGNAQEAAEKFKEFALIWQGYPQEEQARILMGDCYMKLKDYDSALEAYNKARAKASSDERMILAMLGMGRANMAKENYKAALVAFDAAIKRDPSSAYVPIVMAEKAECMAKNGDDEGARKILEGIMSQYEGTPHYRMALDKLANLGSGGFDALQPEAQRFAVAEKEFREGNCEAAITRFQGLLKKFPKGQFAAKSQQGIARCYAKMGNMEEAGDAFMAVAEKYPDSPIAVACLREAVGCYKDIPAKKEAALKKIASDYAESGKADAIQYQAALTAFEEEEYERAAKSFHELIEKFPRSTYCEGALFQEAYCYYASKKYEDAEKKFAEFIKAYPKSDKRAEASYMRGDALYALKKPADAVKEFKACLSYSPSDKIAPVAHFLMGSAYLDLNKLDDALSEYNKAAAAAAGDAKLAADARYFAAIVYSKQGKQDECAQRLLDILNDFRTYPLQPNIMVFVADYCVRKKDFANAALVGKQTIVQYEKDEAAAPHIEKAYTLVGDACMQTKQWKDARDAFQKLVEKFPKTKYIATAKLGIAECYKQLDQFDKAVVELQELIPMATGDLVIEAQEKLADVHEAKGGREEAARVLERAALLAPADVKKTPAMIRLNLRLGKLCEALGKPADALNAYRAAESIPTSDPKIIEIKKVAQERIRVLSAR